MKRILKPTIVIIAVIVLGIILYPIFAQPRPYDPIVPELSSVKQLGMGTLIYVADYDEQFPIATQMSGLRATLFPYIKNAEQFKEIPLKAGPKEFNFNFAAVSTAALPIGASTQPAVEETTIWYCMSANKEKPGAFHSRIDSSVKFISLPTLFHTFQYHNIHATTMLLLPLTTSPTKTPSIRSVLNDDLPQILRISFRSCSCHTYLLPCIY